MASIDLGINIEVKSIDDARKKVQELGKQLEELKKTEGDNTEAVKQMELIYSKAEKALEDFERQSKRASSVLGEVKDEQEKANKSSRVFIGTLDELKEAQRKLSDVLKKARENGEQETEAFIEADDALKDLNKEIKEREKLQKQTIGGTNKEITSTRSLINVFRDGVKASKSLAGGFKAVATAIMSNPIGLVLTAVASAVSMLKSAWDSSKQSAEDYAKGLEKIKSSADDAHQSLLKLQIGEDNYNEREYAKRQGDIKLINDYITKYGSGMSGVKLPLSSVGGNTESSRYTQLIINKYKDLFEGAGIEFRDGYFASAKDKQRAMELLKVEQDILQTKQDTFIEQKRITNEQTKEKAIEEKNKQSEKDKQQAVKEKEKAEQERLKQLAEQNSFVKKLANAYNAENYTEWQISIDSMKDVGDKQLEQLELNHKKELQAVNDFEMEMLNAYNKAYKTSIESVEDLPEPYKQMVKGIVASRTAKSNSAYTLGQKSVYRSNAENIMTKNKSLSTAFGYASSRTKTELRRAEQELTKFLEMLQAENGTEDGVYCKLLYGKDWEKTVEELKSDTELVTKQIEATKKALDGINKTETGYQKFVETFKSISNDDSLAFEENMSNAVSYIEQMTSGLSEASQWMHQLAETSGNANLEKVATTFDRVAENINSAGTGAQVGASASGSWIGAVIGAVVAGGTNIIKQVIESKAERKALKKEIDDVVESYQKLLENANKETDNSIFGSSGTQSAINNLEQVRREIEQLKQSYESMSGVMSLGSLQGFMNRFGSNYGFLNGDGTYNLQNLENAYDTGLYKNLGLTEKGIEDFIKLIDKLKEAESYEDEILQNMTNVFGVLGNTLANDLVNAFKKGESAGEAMAKSIDGVFDTYFTNLLSEDLSNLLSQYDERLSIANEKGDLKEIAKIQEEIKQKASETEQNWVSKYGGLISKDGTTSSATAKGIAQASQDSIDELNGRFTTIQSHTYQITEMMRDFSSRNETILNEIMGIHTDTSGMYSILDNMNRNGVRLQQ